MADPKCATQAAEPDNQAEKWAARPDVQPLLVRLLSQPWENHSAAVAAALNGRQLSELHAFGLWRLVTFSDKKIAKREGKWKASQHAGAAFAYHTWLYHLLGGADAELVPPSTNDVAFGKELYDRARRWGGCCEATLARLDKAVKRAAANGSGDGPRAELQSLRLQLYDLNNLRRVSAVPQVAKHTTNSGGGGGGGGSSTSAPEARAACLRAFAMGTHPRLGAGYAHRDEPCAVRLLGGHHDLLGAIANCLRHGHVGRVLQPRAKEIYELRRINCQLSRECEHHRSATDALQQELWLQSRALTASLAREAAGARQLEQLEADCAEAAAEHAEDRHAWQAELRKLREAHKVELMEWERRVEAVSSSAVESQRERVATQRAERQRLASERDAAQQQHDEARRRVQQLEQCVECVRSSSKAQLQAELAEAREKITELSRRRKANQRKICDVNLADRRAAVAQEQAAAIKLAFNDYCMKDHAQQLAAARADSLERELERMRAQLAAEVHLRERFEAVAQPPKEKFFAHGQFTTDVNLTALQVCTIPSLRIVRTRRERVRTVLACGVAHR